MSRNPMNRMHDLATKGDVVNAIQTIVLPLTRKIDELEARLRGVELSRPVSENTTKYPTEGNSIAPTDSEGAE